MLLSSPLRLASGIVLPNRLAKASTSERLAARGGGPSEGLAKLYERWGAGGAGLLLTGNVIVDAAALEAPHNVVVEDDRHLPALRDWATRAQAGGAKLVMQLSHAGRQSPRSATRDPVSASSVAMKGSFGVMGKPRALEDGEIVAIVERFARATSVARAAGFAGVQIHAAHGYLVSQFLSPKTNLRTDRWGGALENRMRFLLEIVRACKAAGAGGEGWGRASEASASGVSPSRSGLKNGGPSFAVMVKLNSADFQRGGFGEDESMAVVEALEAEGVDLLEVSGGNYESTAMFGRSSTKAREAYFLDYVEKVRARTKLPLMLTGGFRTAHAMQRAIGGGAVDVIGLARPVIVEPDLPRRLIDGTAAGAAHDQIRGRGRVIDDLVQATWYARQLRRMSRGQDPDPTLGRFTSLLLEAPRAYAFNPFAALLPRPRRRAITATASAGA